MPSQTWRSTLLHRLFNWPSESSFGQFLPSYKANKMSDYVRRDSPPHHIDEPLEDTGGLVFMMNTNADKDGAAFVRPACPLSLPPPNQQLVIELYDLKEEDDGWVECARWIKYEEDVEGQDSHWGKPHVACLLFETLNVLRQLLSEAILVTNVTGDSYDSIVGDIAQYLTATGHADVKQKVVDLVNLRQIHVSSRRMVRNGTSLSKLVHSSSTTGHRLNQLGRPGMRSNKSMPFAQHLSSDESSLCIPSTPRIPERARSSAELLQKRTPTAAAEFDVSESAQVFVGEVPEWEKARMILVRLDEAVELPECHVLFKNSVVEATYPVRFLVFILGPPGAVTYHEMGRSLCTMLATTKFKELAYTAINGKQLMQGLDSFLQDSVVLPPGEIDSKRLIQNDEIKKLINRRKHINDLRQISIRERSSTDQGITKEEIEKIGRHSKFKFFGGMMNDITGRLKHYKSDITDAWNSQCLSAIIFMFLATITPAVTFGGLMETYTGDSMGMIETLLSQSICGILFAIFSAQPMIIVAATGPVLLFEGSLYAICRSLDFDFLSVRSLCGSYILLISLIVVACEGSRLLHYVTRFIEEIFSILISIIFAKESFHHLQKTFHDNPIGDIQFYIDKQQKCINSTAGSLHPDECLIGQPNLALLDWIVFWATFFLAIAFFKIRKSYWFGGMFRKIMGDFGVFFAVVIVAVIVQLTMGQVHLETLVMPMNLSFTNMAARGHGLIVLPLLSNLTAHLVAFGAALLVFILLFVETEITEILVSRKERKLVKGTGLNWDLLLVGILAQLCSWTGLPWMCAAAVQSLAHVGSLTVTKKKAPGEKDMTVTVLEQRVTGICISLLTGIFALLGRYITIPNACLFGVFLYLGVMNVVGLQFVDRIRLLFVPVKYYPTKGYVNAVSTWALRGYTVVQAICLIFIFAVKMFKPTSIAFPFALVLLVAIRHIVLPRIFSKKHLQLMDGEEGEIIEDLDNSSEDYFGKVIIPV